ncbi:hypothetical protein PybrP1_008760 [[Pythium] brassicae (nom. inval.)]|nr:hypothetical protein PybrP1_008760 [[Pythium] brassicae (nom. inval.)]
MSESKRRHRFVRMDERLETLQAELQLHGKTNATAEALTFQEELALQAELTMIESFQTLYRKLQPLVTTTPQLLHHVKKVARLLQHELRQAPTADVQRERVVPVLKLLTALARELRKEFYPHFAGILPDVIAIIDTKDPELSTQVFKTITMLFNYLRVQILKDMEAVHKCYFPLLGHPKPFVRDFAAQTLSVLLRRVDSPKDLKKYLSTYFRALARGSGKDDEVLQDGSAKLLFALVRNVNHGFHSRMGEIFLFLLGAFRPKPSAHDDDAASAEQRAVVHDIARTTNELMTKHTDADNAGEMLDCFVLALAKLAATTHADSDVECLYLSRVLHMFSFFVRYRGGRLVAHAKQVKAVQNVAAQLLAIPSVLSTCNVPLREELVPFLEGVWRLFPDTPSVLAAQVATVFRAADSTNAPASADVTTYWRARLLQLAEQIFTHTSIAPEFVTTHVLPNTFHLAFETLLRVDVAAFATLITGVGSYVAAHEAVAAESPYVVFANGHRFLTYAPVQPHALTDASLLEVASRLASECVDAKMEADAMHALATAWKFGKALALLRVDDSKMLAFVQPAIAQVEQVIATSATATTAAAFGAFRAELWRLLQIAEHQTQHAAQQLPSDVVVAALSGKQSSFATLSAFFEFVQMKTEAQQHELLSKDGLAAVAALLKDNLRSQSHELRLVTLEILARHDRHDFVEAGDAALQGKCDLPDVCLSLERLCSGVTVDTEREVIRLIGRVKILCRSPQTPMVYKLLAVHHLFGLYHVKFATIWPHIADAVDVAARTHFAETWAIVTPELLAASVRQDAKGSDVNGHAAASSADDVVIAPDAAPSSSALTIEREFRSVCALETGRVDPASVTDLTTHHTMLWKGLEKFSELVESKTKFVVPLFLVLLRDQYAAIYTDELSPAILAAIDDAVAKLDAAGTLEAAQWRHRRTFTQLTTKSVRTKFLDQLKLFATFKNMKGAFAHSLLHELFFDLLMKSDEVVSKLALQCLFCFGKKHLAPYKEQLNRIADSATFREELTNFNISEEAGAVLQEHRPQLLPVLMRLLYSKCVSKKGRNTGDTVAARRAAILAYLAALEDVELASFVELVVRAFDVEIAAPTSAKQTVARAHVANVALESVQPSRVLGFLNLLEDLVGQLGTKLATYVPALADLLVSILKLNADAAAAMDVDDEEATANDNHNNVVGDDDSEQAQQQQKPEYSASMRKQIRMLVYRRLAEMVDAFDHVVELRPWVEAVFAVSSDAIEHLPKAVVGAGKASALLDFLVAVARGVRTRCHLTTPLVKSVISCLAAGLESATSDAAPVRGLSPEILDSVLQFMASLLDGDEAALVETTDSDTSTGLLLIPEIPFILDQFIARFHSKTARYAAERYAGSSKKELVFLCRLSAHIGASTTLSAKAARDLFQLLLPFLQRNHHPSPADTENILQVLAQLVPQLAEPKKHVLSLSKLLAPGPNCIADRAPREKLIGVFKALGSHPTLPALARVAELLEALNAFDAKKIEEIDFERRVDALNSVNNTAFAGFLDDAHLLAPLTSQYLQSMHDGEFSIRSGALAGLSTLVTLVARAVEADAEAADKSVVVNVLESLVMPCVRVSLKSTVEETRRGFVMLLGNVADHHAALRRFSFVHADLAVLRNKEDPEADFFFNITHIQAHRKRRALQRVAQLMDEMATTAAAAPPTGSDDAMDVDDSAGGGCFSNATVNNVVLPLVMHFIYEAQTKSQESIRAEAAACVGSAAGLLGWSHYLALLRRLLKSIDGHEEMENTIIQAICAAIDHFHYPAPGAIVEWDSTRAPSRRGRAAAAAAAGSASAPAEEANGSKIQDSLEAQVLPMLKKYLFKGVTKKGKEKASSATFDDSAVSSQDVAVRVPLALAVVKVLRRLRAGAFYLEFPKLLLSIAKLLKSKDEAVRGASRTTLVRITMELGITYLLPVVEELKATLRDGYMVHVLSYTLHAILDKAATLVAAKKPPSLADAAPADGAALEREFASPLDACIPSMMDILLDDLFRGVVENQDGSEQRKSKMKEAKGSRSLDALELLARTVPFLPNPSIHVVVAALVRRFREAENAKSALVLHDALKRVALGLVKNASVDQSYVFLYVHNLLNACLESLRPLTELEKAKYKQAAATVKNAGGALVASWHVNEKSARATAELAKRAPRLEGAKVTLQTRMTGYDRHALQDASDSVAHLEELLNFSVFLAFAFLRAGEAAPALVDPLVPQLLRCASEVKNNKAVVHALKALAVLLHHDDLPSMDVALAPLVDRLFKIIHKAGASTRNEMVQTCYRTLTGILKHRGRAYRLTEPQLRVLLGFVRADLEEKDHQNATYALLKAIIASRLVIPEVYDVMLRVGELLVQSDAQSARGNCAAIYLSFLLEYPLGPKRITHHLTFLLNNLSYAYESGRRAVLEALGALLKKLPLELLNERAQFFLLPLVLRVANDEAAACRELAADVIRTLLRRMGNRQLNESVLLLGKWWAQHADAKLVSTAAQVTTLVLETRPEFLDKSAPELFASAAAALSTRLSAMDALDDSSELEWPVVLHVVGSLTKFGENLGGKFESWLGGAAGRTLLDDVVLPLLEYPHALVRLATLRFVASYLRRRNAATLQFAQPLKKLGAGVAGDEFLTQPGKLFALASGVARLFEKPEFTVEVADEALFSLSFLVSALEAFAAVPQYVSTPAVPATEDVVSAPVDGDDPSANDNGDDNNEAARSGSDSDDDDGETTTTTTITTEQAARDEQAKATTPIGWLLTRLSFLSRTVKSSDAVRGAVFKLFAALVSQRDASFAERYLLQMLNPLFRAASSLKEQQQPAESSLLAQEVLELLEGKIGAAQFMDAYTFVQKKLAVFRATRREKRKRDLVNDPQLAAKRKIQKNETKRRAKQLKKRKYTVMKGTASAATRPRKAMRPGAE